MGRKRPIPLLLRDGARPYRSVAELGGLPEGDTVEVSLAPAGGLLLTPSRPRRVGYSLDDLLGRITPEILHEEATMGRPVGEEAL